MSRDGYQCIAPNPVLRQRDVTTMVRTGTPFVVPDQNGYGSEVASSGDGYLVVYEAAGKIWAVRVDLSGSLLEPGVIDLGETQGTHGDPSVAFGDGHILVTFTRTIGEEPATIQGRFVRPDGTLQGTSSCRIGQTGGYYPAVAYLGQSFVAAYLQVPGYNLALATLSADGTSGIEQCP